MSVQWIWANGYWATNSVHHTIWTGSPSNVLAETFMSGSWGAGSRETSIEWAVVNGKFEAYYPNDNWGDRYLNNVTQISFIGVASGNNTTIKAVNRVSFFG